jgi:hypothetical protein
VGLISNPQIELHFVRDSPLHAENQGSPVSEGCKDGVLCLRPGGTPRPRKGCFEVSWHCETRREEGCYRKRRRSRGRPPAPRTLVGFRATSPSSGRARPTQRRGSSPPPTTTASTSRGTFLRSTGRSHAARVAATRPTSPKRATRRSQGRLPKSPLIAPSAPGRR